MYNYVGNFYYKWFEEKHVTIIYRNGYIIGLIQESSVGYVVKFFTLSKQRKINETAYAPLSFITMSLKTYLLNVEFLSS